MACPRPTAMHWRPHRCDPRRLRGKHRLREHNRAPRTGRRRGCRIHRRHPHPREQAKAAGSCQPRRAAPCANVRRGTPATTHDCRTGPRRHHSRDELHHAPTSTAAARQHLPRPTASMAPRRRHLREYATDGWAGACRHSGSKGSGGGRHDADRVDGQVDDRIGLTGTTPARMAQCACHTSTHMQPSMAAAHACAGRACATPPHQACTTPPHQACTTPPRQACATPPHQPAPTHHPAERPTTGRPSGQATRGPGGATHHGPVGPAGVPRTLGPSDPPRAVRPAEAHAGPERAERRRAVRPRHTPVRRAERRGRPSGRATHHGPSVGPFRRSDRRPLGPRCPRRAVRRAERPTTGRRSGRGAPAARAERRPAVGPSGGVPAGRSVGPAKRAVRSGRGLGRGRAGPLPMKKSS